MKKEILVIGFIFISINIVCSQMDTFNNIHNKDSLKKVLNIEDSIRILKIDTIQKSIAFIDYNRNSKFHSRLLQIRGNRMNRNYNSAYKKQHDMLKLDENPKIPDYLINKWIKLYKYKGEFYVYLDCNFQMVYELSDTAFITYSMDGGYPSSIIKYEEKNATSKIITYKNDTLDFIRTDKNSIFKIKLKNDCAYFTPATMINSFDIIVHYCNDMSDDIVEFEKIECK